MTVEYTELIKAMGLDSAEYDKASAKAYYFIRKILLIMSFIFAVLTVVTAIFFPHLRNMTLGITFLLVVAAFLNSEWRYKKMEEILYKHCDPERFLPRYMSILSVTGKRGKWGRYFYNVFIAVYSKGDFATAKAVLEAFSKHCKDARRLFRYELCAALMAYHIGDLEGLEKNLRVLTKTREMINTTGETEDLYDEAMQLRTMASVMKNKDYRQGFEAYADFDSKKNEPQVGNYETMLNAVRRNYFLWQLAVLIDDYDSIERLEKFIIENGGGTFYRLKVEKHIADI
jgi:hypothetical protein